MAKELIYLAKGLRKRSTDVEQFVWSRLRAGRLEGMKFRRQRPIGKYIADFVCLERKLIIELDGSQHALPDGILKDRHNETPGLKKKATRLCVFGIMRSCRIQAEFLKQ